MRDKVEVGRGVGVLVIVAVRVGVLVCVDVIVTVCVVVAEGVVVGVSDKIITTFAGVADLSVIDNPLFPPCPTIKIPTPTNNTIIILMSKITSVDDVFCGWGG